MYSVWLGRGLHVVGILLLIYGAQRVFPGLFRGSQPRNLALGIVLFILGFACMDLAVTHWRHLWFSDADYISTHN